MIDNEAKENILKILKAISSGIDPLTGECFDRSGLSSDHDISHAIRLLAMTTRKQSRFKGSDENGLAKRPIKGSAQEIYFDLIKWRTEQVSQNGDSFFTYHTLTNKMLRTIANADIYSKKQLVTIKGMTRSFYDRYSDDIMAILYKHMKYPEQFESINITADSSTMQSPTVKVQKTVTTSVESPIVNNDYTSAKASIDSPSKSEVNTCENCMEKKKGDCFGAKAICEFFRPSPTSIEGKEDWPKYGDATFFRLTRGKR